MALWLLLSVPIYLSPVLSQISANDYTEISDQRASDQQHNFIYIDLSDKNVYYLSAELADAYCKDQFGAGLVSWSTESQYQALKDEIDTRCTHKSLEYWSDCKAYIGLKRIDETNFVWEDGTNCTYTGTKNGFTLCVNKWHPLEPNNAFGNEQCVEMSRNGHLNDINCGIPYKWDDGFFCSVPDNYTPSPTEFDDSPVNTDRLIVLNNTINNINVATNPETTNTTNNMANKPMENTKYDTMSTMNGFFSMNTSENNLNLSDDSYFKKTNNNNNNVDIYYIAIGFCLLILIAALYYRGRLPKKYCCKKKKQANVDEQASEQEANSSTVSSFCSVTLWSHKDSDEQLSVDDSV